MEIFILFFLIILILNIKDKPKNYGNKNSMNNRDYSKDYNNFMNNRYYDFNSQYCDCSDFNNDCCNDSGGDFSCDSSCDCD